jgi:hypothetical protein
VKDKKLTKTYPKASTSGRCRVQRIPRMGSWWWSRKSFSNNQKRLFLTETTSQVFREKAKSVNYVKMMNNYTTKNCFLI